MAKPSIQLWRASLRFKDMDKHHLLQIAFTVMVATMTVFTSPSISAQYERKAAAAGSSEGYIAFVDSADNYIKRERWEDAERMLIAAMRLEPANFSNALLFSNLGVVRTEMHRYPEALDAFELGLSLSPGSTTLRNNRARTLILVGDYETAKADLDTSLSTDSLQQWPLQIRGTILLSDGKIDEARKDFLSLSRHFPSNAAAMTGLARVAQREGKLPEALRYLDEAISIDDSEDLHGERIILKINMQKYSEAAEEIRTCIKKNPENPYFYLWRGVLNRLNYLNEEAAADRKIALNKGADPQIVEQFMPSTRR